jgi:hypothetical protein
MSIKKRIDKLDHIKIKIILASKYISKKVKPEQ